MKPAIKKIKVIHNIWGNFCCFIGTEKVQVYGSEYDAKVWLVNKLEEGGYVLSDKNYIPV